MNETSMPRGSKLKHRRSRPLVTWALIIAVAVVLFWSLTNKNAFGANVKDNIYYGEVVSVYDGDTFMVRIELWPGIFIRTKIRASGFDTPEIRTKCKREKEMAVKARKATMTFLSGWAVLRNIHNGKYAGRVVADVYSMDGDSLKQHMINIGLARAYDGKSKRKGWCDGKK